MSALASEVMQDLSPPAFRLTARAWLLIGALTAVMMAIFASALALMWERWATREEFSHGFLIPVIALFLLWQRRDRLEREPFTGSWAGVGVVLLGLAIFFLGELSTITTLVQYAFVIVLAAAAVSWTGLRALRLYWVPLALLLFMVPLPYFLTSTLSAKLQLMSSGLGAGLIRLFDIGVYLEGNVIDLGTYRLQVIEACSGLRYLFPLMTLGVVMACFFRAPRWQRFALFLSTLPITVVMNSFRIGVIGLLVEYRGPAMAEGFLHWFEGWIIFMACFALLFLEMWVIARLTGDRRPFRAVFNIELPPRRDTSASTRPRIIPAPARVSTVLLALAAYPATALPQRAEVAAPRLDFAEFPAIIGAWKGSPDWLETIFLEELKLDDYLLMNYTNGEGEVIVVYAAYYASQRKGQSAHTPKVCLPGGGWQLKQFDRRTLPAVDPGGTPLTVNRALIQHGEERQLAYYWFRQRGRNLTNEYLVKWFIFWDALTRSRSDGALIRLTTPVAKTADIAPADRRLSDFAAAIGPALPAHVPN